MAGTLPATVSGRSSAVMTVPSARIWARSRTLDNSRTFPGQSYPASRVMACGYTVDLPAAVGGPTAYAGFAAGTGELFAPIDVLTWQYVSTDNWDVSAVPL